MRDRLSLYHPFETVLTASVNEIPEFGNVRRGAASKPVL
jgi:hypothetical protein